MKAFMWITRIGIILLTACFGLLFGVVAPIFLMDMEIEGVSANPVLIVWIVFAIIGYFLPCILNNLKLFKLSACFAAAGTLMMLYIHSEIKNYMPDGGFMYLPQMFVTILAVLYAIFIIFNERGAKTEKDKKAPSILGDE